MNCNLENSLKAYKQVDYVLSHAYRQRFVWLKYNDNTWESQTATNVAHLLMTSFPVTFLQMGGGGHLVPVSREGLSGSEEGKVWPRSDHRHSARRPGQPEGGALLPQEESRRGESSAKVKITSDVISECLLIKIATLLAMKCSLV